MSTPLLHRFCTRLAMTLAVLALGAYACADTAAQQINVLVRLMPESSRVAVEGSCPANTSWSFRDSFAGVVGLGQRIEQFAALDESGQEIATRKLAPGQFESAQAAAHIRYEVNLTPQFSGSDSARVSWLKEQRGLFMLADLLPVLTSNRPRDAGAVVQFKMPDGWVVYPQEKKDSQIGPFVGEIDRLVFAAGSHLRASTLNESGMTFTLITDGEWAFTDADLRELAGRVLQAHRDVFGAMPAKQGTLILFPFPGAALATQWSAETRGA
ncbi:MAG TPA: hypothetical protein VKD91_06420, partial [Pyrinomonadaceae bacterium]|nr:hypothetical protein [Pyrinomonadaceae bacterium]